MTLDDRAAALRHAMQLHAAGDVEGGLAAARALLATDPGFGEAWAYVGNTLVTRKRQFADGIAALELAVKFCPDDPAVWYTLGWCREFAANALARPKGGRVQSGDQLTAHDADALYQQAKEAMLHALTLNPEPGLRGDITDILDVIASATGEPWTDEPR
jgi:tetratricopeptide (TPR) repeat protein